MTPKKWARVRKAGAHGLRRGAWYPVVNDQKPTIVFLEVHKRNVAVDRSLLEFSDIAPTRWVVVMRDPEEQRGKRASDAGLQPTYGVCPTCRTRANLVADVDTAICPGCGSEYGIDWERPS